MAHPFISDIDLSKVVITPGEPSKMHINTTTTTLLL
jgi:hypothetical protein